MTSECNYINLRWYQLSKIYLFSQERYWAEVIINFVKTNYNLRTFSLLNVRHKIWYDRFGNPQIVAEIVRDNPNKPWKCGY